MWPSPLKPAVPLVPRTSKLGCQLVLTLEARSEAVHLPAQESKRSASCRTTVCCVLCVLYRMKKRKHGPEQVTHRPTTNRNASVHNYILKDKSNTFSLLLSLLMRQSPPPMTADADAYLMK